MTAWRRTRLRIADPNGVGWTMTWTFTLAVLADRFLGFGRRDVDSWSHIPLETLEVVMGAAATIAVLLVARLAYLRTRYCRRHSWVMLTTFLIAVVFGTVVTAVAGAAFTTASTATNEGAGLDQILFETCVLAVIAAVLGSIREYRADLHALTSVQEALELARARGEDAVRRERAETAEAITLEVERALAATPRERLDDVIAHLRDTARSVVRPLSHQLAATSPEFEAPKALVPAPPWRHVITASAMTPLLRPITMALVMTLLAGRLSLVAGESKRNTDGDLAVTVDWLSLAQAILQLGMVFISVWLISSAAVPALARVLPRMGPAGQWTTTILTTLGVSIVAQALLLLGFAIPGVSPQTSQTAMDRLVFAVPLIAVVLITGCIHAVSSRRSAILESVQAYNTDLAFEVARVNAELWRQRRGLSTALHGSVQASMNAGAIRLSLALERGEEVGPLTTEILREIHTTLDEMRQDRPSRVKVSHEFDIIRATWSGACRIDFEVEPALLSRIERDQLCSTAMVDIVSEACANAVIHGGASSVAVRLAAQGERLLRIEIRDDGHPDSPRQQGGLGESLLEEVCTHWRLDLTSNGAHLVAELPLD